MAPYGARDGGYYASSSSLSLSTNNIQDDPKYLILHESIKLLVKEVLDLKDRCNGLEESNDGLRRELEEQKMQAVVQQIPHRNLTGYANSEGSEQNYTNCNLDVSNPQDMLDPNDIIRTLSRHEGKLQEVDSEHQALVARLYTIETMQETYKPTGTQDPASTVTTTDIKQVQDEIDRLKVFQRKMTSLQEQERIIDDAASKETLNTYFEELSSIIVSSDQPFMSKGKFKGNFDDLFTLRSRVVRRLALHEQYEAVYKDIMKR